MTPDQVQKLIRIRLILTLLFGLVVAGLTIALVVGKLDILEFLGAFAAWTLVEAFFLGATNPKVVAEVIKDNENLADR